MTIRKKIKNSLESALEFGLTCAGLIIATPLVLIAAYIMKEPKVKTKPTIPRFSDNGKIRFLERQLRNYNIAREKRYEAGASFCDDMTSYNFTKGRVPEVNLKDLDEKRKQVIEELILLYEKKGDYDKINGLKH